jgi:predicted nucleic acid-binding protein
LIVIDASVLANVVADDGADGQTARDVVGGVGGLSAPDLVDVETVAVLRKRWLAGTLSATRFATAIDDLMDLEVERYPGLPLLGRVYELRDNVSAYDAVYVALAEGLACTLLTADARLVNAPGPRCDVRLLESN